MGRMGLGGARGEWADYEWFSLAEYVGPASASGTDTSTPLVRWLEAHPVWVRGQGRRLLLVDLDNLRADPRRWRARMAFVLALAREADDVVLAGQVGAVRRARPHLAELADSVRSVADGSDLADHVLLDAADGLAAGTVQIVVLSNDGIFTSLADRGRLVVISPGGDALSDRLGQVADVLVDLAVLEGQGASGAVPEQRTGTGKAVRKAVASRGTGTGIAAKKPGATRAAAKSPAAKKATAKKATAKKATAKKAAAKKATAKPAAKKAAPKKAAAKKLAARKTTARKTTAGTTTARKTTAKKSG